MSPKGNGLQDLQHEYGHILDYKKGKLKYIFSTMPGSFISTVKQEVSLLNHRHKNYSTEVPANQLSTEYFGPKSAIGTSYYYPRK